MRIPISICSSSSEKKNAEANALIDSGAAGYFIDWGFIRKHSITTRSIDNPILVRNVDGTPNKTGSITKACDLRFQVEKKEMTATFLVTTLGGEDIILGLPWLRQVNPTINWKEDLITIKQVLTLRQQQQPTVEDIDDDEEIFSDAQEELEEE
jgi:hypothetical protein